MKVNFWLKNSITSGTLFSLEGARGGWDLERYEILLILIARQPLWLFSPLVGLMRVNHLYNDISWVSKRTQVVWYICDAFNVGSLAWSTHHQWRDWLLWVYFLKLTLCFKLFSKRRVEQMLECQAHEAHRLDHLHDLHLFYQGVASLFHRSLPSILSTADQFLWQKPRAVLLDILGLGSF